MWTRERGTASAQGPSTKNNELMGAAESSQRLERLAREPAEGATVR